MPFDNPPVLSDDDLRARAPSIFATQAAASVSERYAFIPSYPVVRMLRLMGIQPIEARQGTKRAPDGREYAIHRIRFRKVDSTDWAGQTRELGMIVPEVQLLNSHDRTSPMAFRAGLERLVCLNGMTVMESGMSFAVRHVGKNIGDVVADVQGIVANFGRIVENAREWDQIQLASEQIVAFADKAVALRGTSVSLEPSVLTHARRDEDKGTSLWKVFNRVQENLMRGGLPGQSARGAYRTLRPIKSLAVDDEFNRKLWQLASELAAEVRPSPSSVVAG